MDFTLSNARRFYLSEGDPLGVKELKTISLNPFTPKSDLIDFTLSNVRGSLAAPTSFKFHWRG